MSPDHHNVQLKSPLFLGRIVTHPMFHLHRNLEGPILETSLNRLNCPCQNSPKFSPPTSCQQAFDGLKDVLGFGIQGDHFLEDFLGSTQRSLLRGVGILDAQIVRGRVDVLDVDGP